MTGDIYCMHCGSRLLEADSPCAVCGRSQDLGRDERAGRIAFLLNELDRRPASDVIGGQARALLRRHYELALGRARGDAPVAASAARGETGAAAPPESGAMAAPAAPRRRPRDWSWLEEQQASLFLFAGAFLTVVAALIYVAYSGQNVDGALKMTLLVVYTGAFLAAGAVCVGRPSVRIAGQVFLAVGAILVPMNFVAARTVLGGQTLDAESMWLAGSVVSAAFYFALGRIGFGRMYAFGSGVAVVSATLAALAVSEPPSVLVPGLMLFAAAAMLLPELIGDALTRERIGPTWTAQSQVVAVLAMLAALVVTLDFGQGSSHEAAARWYLPLTFVAWFAYAGGPLAAVRRTTWGMHALAATVAAAFAMVFALGRPYEWYAVAATGTAMLLGIGARFAPDALTRGLPPRAAEHVRSAAFVLAGVGVVIAATAMQRDAREAQAFVHDPYRLQTRWFLVVALAPLVGWFTLDAFRGCVRWSAGLMLTAVAAVLLAVVYSLEASPEYTAFALLTAAAAGATLAMRPAIARQASLPRELVAEATHFTLAGVIGGLVLAAGFATLSVNESFPPQTRWFLLPAFGAAAVLFAVLWARCRTALTRELRDVPAYGLTLSMPGVAAAVVYGAALPAEYYGVAFIASAFVVAAGGRMVREMLDFSLPPRSYDFAAILSVAMALVPLAPVYAGAPWTGSVVYLTGAAFFVEAAIVGRDGRRLAGLLRTRELDQTLRAALWLYPAGASFTVGYLYALNAASVGPEAGGSAVALALVAAAGVWACAAALVGRTRRDIAVHLYIVAAAITAASALSAESPLALAVVLSIGIAIFMAAALFEEWPGLGAVSAAAGFAAVVAWQRQLDAPLSSVPLTYSATAVACYAAAVLLRSKASRWSSALRIAGSLYAVVAPVVAQAILVDRAHGRFETVHGSSMFAWWAVIVGVTGALAIVESAMSRRSWLMLPASALIAASMLIAVGRVHPASPQAYTAIIGGYLLFAGAVGIARLRWAPAWERAVPFMEAAGAFTIMLPSALEAWNGDARYLLLLLGEAAVLLSAGVLIRRRGMAGAGITALVLVSGRMLFDAANALPNWVSVMVAGLALLVIGFAILAGRERFLRWQHAVLDWWAGPSALPR